MQILLYSPINKAVDIILKEKFATGENSGQKKYNIPFSPSKVFGVLSQIKTRFCWFKQAGKLLTFFSHNNPHPLLVPNLS